MINFDLFVQMLCIAFLLYFAVVQLQRSKCQTQIHPTGISRNVKRSTSHTSNMLQQYVGGSHIIVSFRFCFPNRKCSLLIYQSFTHSISLLICRFYFMNQIKQTHAQQPSVELTEWKREYSMKWNDEILCALQKRLKLSVCLSKATSSACILSSNWMRPTKFFFLHHSYYLCFLSFLYEIPTTLIVDMHTNTREEKRRSEYIFIVQVGNLIFLINITFFPSLFSIYLDVMHTRDNRIKGNNRPRIFFLLEIKNDMKRLCEWQG